MLHVTNPQTLCIFYILHVILFMPKDPRIEKEIVVLRRNLVIGSEILGWRNLRLWSQEESEILFSPWVMRSAWNKVFTWYSGGEWHDPAELLAWKAEPWRHLAKLALELSKGTYEPQAFPEVPYPKKGGYTRHYVMPSVRDQVAFTVFLVLLGPFLEARMPNICFGSRLYWPRVLKLPRGSRNSGRKRWFQAPFSLSHRRIYTGFPASYGLFRRLLQWLVNRCIVGEEAIRSLQEPFREDPDSLPYRDLPREGMSETDLVYARLDLKMAYPSLDRRKLRNTMIGLIKSEPSREVWPGGREKTDSILCPPKDGWYSGNGRPNYPSLVNPNSKGFPRWLEPYRRLTKPHPWGYLAQEGHDNVRVRLVEQLMDMLDNVVYSSWDVPGDWKDSVNSMYPCFRCSDASRCAGEMGGDKSEWIGPHGFLPLSNKSFAHFERIIDRNAGLPTGLAISGLLFNVAFTPIDETMLAVSRRVNSSGRVFFYLRFVDDVVMLASDPRDLEMAIMIFQDSLCRFMGTKVRVNISKVRPRGVREFLNNKSEWEEKSEPNQENPTMIVSSETKRYTSGNGKQLNEIAEGDAPRSQLEYYLGPDDYLTRGNLELFTTTIVREMSGLAEETLGERWGGRGIDRLEQLMDLATLEIDDFEVGADARLSFAVNRLARASWPQTPVVCDDRVLEPEVYVRRILLIAETTLRRHPWRYKLWRSILIIALRASLYQEKLGQKWLLESILPLIKWASETDSKRHSFTSWEEVGPCPYASNQSRHDSENKTCSRLSSLIETQFYRCRERTSFHRTEFWRQWTYCVRMLQRIVSGKSETQVSEGWLGFFSADDAARSLEWFGEIERFAKVIYDKWTWKWKGKPFLWWWEADALCEAVLSILSPSKELLDRLGSPRAQLLRDPTNIGVSFIASKLSKDEEIREQIYSVLSRTRFYKSYRGVLNKHTCTIDPPSALWLVSYFGSWNSTKAQVALEVVPSWNDPRWASLGRPSSWDILHDKITTISLPKFSVAKSISACSSLWREFVVIQDYATLRRLFMAHGLPVTLGLFLQWFPYLNVSDKASGVTCEDTSLYCAVYSLYDGLSASFPHPSQVPAIGVDWDLAHKVISSLKKYRCVVRDITPVTVRLKKNVVKSLVESRKAILVRDNERVFY